MPLLLSKRLNESSVCSLNDSLKDLESYSMGVSYGTVRGSDLFLPLNGSAVFVERTGVLDIRSDNSWGYDSSQGNRTYSRVSGLIGKSDGSANVSLNCLFNDSEGCRKVGKGPSISELQEVMARHFSTLIVAYILNHAILLFSFTHVSFTPSSYTYQNNSCC